MERDYLSRSIEFNKSYLPLEHNNTMTTKELKKKLREAKNVCRDCWIQYGEYKGWVVGAWTATCDICGKKDSCTAPRDRKYFAKTLWPIKYDKFDYACDVYY